MVIQSLLLLVGLALLMGGGDLLVRGASALAKNFGVPPLVIGLTVVAFGTSAPELSINLQAALQGSSEITFGNVIGSNIANIALIVGIAALIRPLTIQGIVISRELPMMLLATLVAVITGMDRSLRGSPDMFDRSDGLVFLLLFCVFLFYTISEVFQKRRSDPYLQQIEVLPEKKHFRRIAANLFLFAVGLTLLVIGGRVTVSAAVAVALHLHVPKVIIGLTIIAVGTSLPELVTSVMATFKGHTDIAVGNIVGSNIFNLLLINGICATVSPIPIPEQGGGKDLFIMLFLSLLLLPISISNRRNITRREGTVLLAFYIGYMIWRIVSG